MAQSFKQLVDEIAGPEPKHEAYRFSHRVFVENKRHGAYDQDNSGNNLTTELGVFLQTEYSDFIEFQGY